MPLFVGFNERRKNRAEDDDVLDQKPHGSLSSYTELRWIDID
jgi:hypothetical protein